MSDSAVSLQVSNDQSRTVQDGVVTAERATSGLEIVSVDPVTGEVFTLSLGNAAADPDALLQGEDEPEAEDIDAEEIDAEDEDIDAEDVDAESEELDALDLDAEGEEIDAEGVDLDVEDDDALEVDPDDDAVVELSTVDDGGNGDLSAADVTDDTAAGGPAFAFAVLVG